MPERLEQIGTGGWDPRDPSLADHISVAFESGSEEVPTELQTVDLESLGFSEFHYSIDSSRNDPNLGLLIATQRTEYENFGFRVELKLLANHDLRFAVMEVSEGENDPLSYDLESDNIPTDYWEAFEKFVEATYQVAVDDLIVANRRTGS